MRQLLIATSNAHKVGEISEILKKFPVEIISLGDLPTDFPAPEETEATFSGNALLKARYYAKQSNLLTAAEDSGLSIATLDGFPGVTSARWLGGSDTDRMRGILEKMKNSDNRSAAYIAVAALVDPISGGEWTFEGVCEGVLTDTPRGSGGFGYDPIFIPSGYSQTMAELGQNHKNSISHRSKAWTKLTKHSLFAS